MNLRKIIVLGFFLTSYAQAEITSLEWPLGENVCIGTWTYTELKLCTVPDYNNRLYEGPIVYPSRNKSCGHWSFGERVIDAKDMSVGFGSRSSVHDEQSLVDWCNYQAKPTKVNSGDLSFWQTGKYEPNNVTQKWVLRDHHVEGDWGICHLELVDQIVQRDPICGTEDDIDHPTKSFSGYGTKTIYAQSCDDGTKAESKTLTYGSSLTTILDLASTDKSSAVCSTTDGAKLDSDAAVQAKAVVLNKEMLAALRLDSSTCAYKLNLAEYTRFFLKQKGNTVTASQQSFLTSVSNLLAKKCGN